MAEKMVIWLNGVSGGIADATSPFKFGSNYTKMTKGGSRKVICLIS